jgi:threonyl-tRNA synthetase
LPYADAVYADLKKEGFRVQINTSADKMGAKIRETTLQKVPFMLVVGGREAETKTVSVRTREGIDLGAMSLADFVAQLKTNVSNKS